MKIPNQLLFFCLLSMGTPSASGQEEIHGWTNKEGRIIDAKFVKGDAETVTIFTNGRDYTVNLSDLRPESLALARKLSAQLASDANSPDSSAAAPQASEAKKGPLPTIRVTEADWGGASLRDIGKVLNSAAKQLWPHASQDRLDTIIVDRSLSGPIVLYRRGNEKQYLVRLDTHKTLWSQYAFQFAHEFGHIMCGYKAGSNENQWFEESLCETASLFALPRMSEAWETAPPYPNWKSYAKHLNSYADLYLGKERARPGGMDFIPWLKKNEKALRLGKRYPNREIYKYASYQLFHLIQKEPRYLGALGYLNLGLRNPAISTRQYLAHWKNTLPAAYKPFADQVAATFGYRLP